MKSLPNRFLFSMASTRDHNQTHWQIMFKNTLIKLKENKEIGLFFYWPYQLQLWNQYNLLDNHKKMGNMKLKTQAKACKYIKSYQTHNGIPCHVCIYDGGSSICRILSFLGQSAGRMELRRALQSPLTDNLQLHMETWRNSMGYVLLFPCSHQ